MFGTQNDPKKDDVVVSNQAFNDSNNGGSGITMPSYSDASAGGQSTAAPAASTIPVTDASSAGAQLPPLPAQQPLPSIISQSGTPVMASTPTTPNDYGVPMPTTTTPAADDDLIGIKHEALSQLSPLVSHIEQTPTEKFRTLMMMIQGADDKTLIKPAYEAAKAITDEKERAQALLDIVNEINYFTQPKESGPQPA